MRFGSVCSGIEAASVAWHPLGWRASFLSEIEAFPRAVLSHHYPEVPLHGDFTTIRAGEYEPIDLLVGGTPCQSFSVAGLRGGLDDDRGNLALEYLRLADRLRPRWLVWENVPGVLSSNGGRDFGAILGGMVELGYGFAYRVLDAQFLGVAQRRRRVFVVGYLGDWRRAAAVLFERHSLSGHPAPRREAGPSVAALTAQGVGTCGADDNQGQAGHLIPLASIGNGEYGSGVGSLRASGADCGGGSETLIAHTLKGEGFDASEDGTGRGTPIVPVSFQGRGSNIDLGQDVTGTLGLNCDRASGGAPCIAFDTTQITSAANYSNPKAGDPCHPLASGAHAPAVAFALRGRDGGAMPEVEGDGDRIGALRAASGGSSRDYVAASAVRRLTPRECERLQGFPEITNELRILVCKSEDEKRALASSAAKGSAALALGPNAPVAVHALIDLERQAVQLHSLGRSPSTASIAELGSLSRLSIPADAFALLAALTNAAVASSIRAGRAASPASTMPSSPVLNGSKFVALSGREIDALASDAERFTGALNACSKSITSQHGLTDPTCASTWETLASRVAVAMTGFIPEAMRSGCSYEIRITTHHGYTAIPYRKGQAADGPRYKALGNSMAVPVMAHIGRRIAQVDAIPHLQDERSAA